MQRILFLALCLLMETDFLAADTLLTSTINGSLVSVDPQTGAILQYHLQPAGNLLAYDPVHGLLYSLPGIAQTPGNLFIIDPTTLQVTKVPLTSGWAGQLFDSIAYDSVAGLLYATAGYYSTPGSTQIYRLDTTTGAVTPVATLTGGMTSLTYDHTAGILYGISTPLGSEGTGSLSVVRIEPRTGLLITVYTSHTPFEFQAIAVIPGTSSFYTLAAGSFQRLDAATGIKAVLGSATGLTGEILFQDFSVAAASPVNGPLSYSISDVCAPATCAASLLNDVGAVAGLSAGPGSALFVARAGLGMTLLPGTEGAVPLGMNNNQDVVGTIAFSEAFLYSRATAQLYNLNTVFGWTRGKAVHINNHGDIAGDSYGTATQTVRGYPLTGVIGITDSGILLGQTPSATGLVLFPNGTTYQVGLVPMVFNNLGQFLTFSSPGNPLIPNGGTALYTPGEGVRALPGGTATYLPLALNDDGIAIFSNGSVFDTSGSIPQISTAPVPLNLLVPPSTGWTNLQLQALNNAGQILALGTSTATGRTTALLLTPNLVATGALVPGLRRPHFDVSGCGAQTLNDAPVDCGMLTRSRAPITRRMGR